MIANARVLGNLCFAPSRRALYSRPRLLNFLRENVETGNNRKLHNSIFPVLSIPRHSITTGGSEFKFPKTLIENSNFPRTTAGLIAHLGRSALAKYRNVTIHKRKILVGIARTFHDYEGGTNQFRHRCLRLNFQLVLRLWTNFYKNSYFWEYRWESRVSIEKCFTRQTYHREHCVSDVSCIYSYHEPFRFY